MATSGSRDFTLTRNQIITKAMRICGLIRADEIPTPEDIRDSSQSLNLMIQGWITQSGFYGLWLKTNTVLFLEAGKQYYDIGPSGDNCTSSYVETTLSSDAASGAGSIELTDASGVADTYKIGVVLDDGTLQWTTINGDPSSSTVTLTAVLTGAATSGNKVFSYAAKISRPTEIRNIQFWNGSNDRPVDVVSEQEYREIANKTTQSDILCAYLDPQLTNMRLWVWPTANLVTDYLKISLILAAEDFDSSSDNAQFPVEWLETIIYNLCKKLIFEYNLQLTPRRQILIAEAERMFRAANSFDKEKTPTQFYSAV